MTWALTSFAVGNLYIDSMRGMVESFRKHHPDLTVITAENPVSPELSWGEITNFKPSWLLAVWPLVRSQGIDQLVWVDADARLARPFVIPEFTQPWAAQKNMRWSTGTMVLQGNPMDLLWEWEDSTPTAEFDEQALQAVIANDPLKTPFDLPKSLTSTYQVNAEAALVHSLASRNVWP